MSSSVCSSLGSSKHDYIRDRIHRVSYSNKYLYNYNLPLSVIRLVEQYLKENHLLRINFGNNSGMPRPFLYMYL